MRNLAIVTLILIISLLGWLSSDAAAQTPPPTPTGVPNMIFSAQDWPYTQYCEAIGGHELLPDGLPVTLYTGNEYNITANTDYGSVQLHYTLEFYQFLSYDFYIYLLGTSDLTVVDYYKPIPPSTIYYSTFTMPFFTGEYVDGPTVWTGIRNEGDVDFKVVSICAKGTSDYETPTPTPTPGPTVTGTPPATATPAPTRTPSPTPTGLPDDDSMCLNSNASFTTPPIEWIKYGNVSYSNGALLLGDNSVIFNPNIPRPTGSTKFEVLIDAWVDGPEVISTTLYAGDLAYTQQVAHTAPRRLIYQFNTSNAYITPMRLDTGATTTGVGRLVVSRVCVRELDPPVTPTPSPTPTPIAPTCANPDSGFDLPYLWWIGPGEIAEMTGGIVRMAGGGGAYITTTLPAGNYHVEFRAKTDYPREGVLLMFGERAAGNYYPGQDFINLTGDGSWRVYTYDTDIHTTGSAMRLQFLEYQSTLMASPDDLSYPVRVEMDYLCLTSNTAATPTPHPTPLPGEPTLTPTPFDPPPTGCRNADPGLDIADQWSIVGGNLAGSQAVLIPGGQLFQNLNYNSSLDYHVTVRARALSGQADLTTYFGGKGQVGIFDEDWRDVVYTFPAGATQLLYSPLTELLEDNWVPSTFISVLPTPGFYSPLATPIPPQAQGVMGGGVLYAEDLLSLQAATYNAANLEISAVCVKSAVPDVDPRDQIRLYHPTCERDYALQRAYTTALLDNHPAIIVGSGAAGGMPVHAMHGGVVTRHDFGHFVGLTNYVHCVELDHTAVYGVPVTSIYCGLATQTLPASGNVERGAVLGFTGDSPDDLLISVFSNDELSGMALVQLSIDDATVDPTTYMEGYPDCRPYQVILDELEPCAADDGTGLIPPRNNLPAPSLWDVSQWVPWLASRVYDTVGYPILCSLVQLYNDAVILASAIANAIINAVMTPLLFLYRLGRIVEFLLDLLGAFWEQLMGLFDAWAAVVLCLRSILTYFIAALRASMDARVAVVMPSTGWLAFGINLALKLLSSTIAALLLTPITVLICGYAAWRVIPWGIKKIRQSVGMGGD